MYIITFLDRYTRNLQTFRIVKFASFIQLPSLRTYSSAQAYSSPSMSLQQIRVQRPRLSHPRRQLRVVPVRVVRVRVDEDAQRAAVHCEPAEECAGLVRREGVGFEHCYGVGA